jgi:hypothetical protein
MTRDQERAEGLASLIVVGIAFYVGYEVFWRLMELCDKLLARL